MSSQDKDVSYKVMETQLEEKAKRTIYEALTVDEQTGLTTEDFTTAQPIAPAPQQEQRQVFGPEPAGPPSIAPQQQQQQPSVDPNALKTQLARFFYTLNYLPKNVYDSVMDALRQGGIDLSVAVQYVNDPDSVRGDPSKYAQIEALVNLINEWERRGYLKQSPEQSPMYSAAEWLARAGIVGPLDEKRRWEEILNEINQGRIPQYKPDASQKVLEFLSKADIINQIYNAVEGSLGKGVAELARRLGADEETARRIGNYASAGATGAITGLLGMVPGLNVYMISSYLVDQVSQLASVLGEPIEREKFLELLKKREFWEDAAAQTALFAVGGVVAARALGPKLTEAVVSSVSKLDPELGAKLQNRLSVTYGTPEYTEQKASYYVDHDKGVVYYRIQSTGQIIPVSTEKLSYAKSLLTDPETGTKIANIIGKFENQKQATDFLNMLDELSRGLGTDKAKALIEKLNAMKPEELRGIVTVGSYSPSKGTQVVDLGGKIAVLTKDKPEVLLLDVKNIPKSEFGLYALAEDTGIGAKTMESILRKALVDKQTGILYKQRLAEGDLVITSDGKTMKIAFGQQVVEVPLESVSLESWQKTQGLMSGLKSSLDATTYESVKSLLKTQYSLTTPVTPTASGVTSAEGLFRAEAQSLYDVLGRKFGFTTPAEVQESAELSVSARIGGKPAQIMVNRQVLGDEKASILVRELTTREFDKSLLGKIGFTEDRVGVIKVQRGLKYLNRARELSRTGDIDPDTVRNAIRLASQSGDAGAVQELALLQKAIERIDRGDLVPIVMESTGSELTVAVAGAGAQAINTLQQQLQRAVEQGDAQAVEQALRTAGLSDQEISTMVVRIPRPIEIEVAVDRVVPRLEYEVVEAYSKETTRDTVVKVPRVIPQIIEREVVVPLIEYETTSVFDREAVSDVIVKIPRVVEIPVEREVVIPIIEYETASVFGREAARDTVVKIPEIIVIDKEEQVPVRVVETETVERYIVEAVPGTVITVPVMVEQPLYIFEVIDVVETEAAPPEQNPPFIRTTAPPVTPAVPMPGGKTTAPSLGGSPSPRGKGEKEKLVI